MIAPDPIFNKDIAPGSILPPGYFYTRLATLHVIQKCKTSADSLIALTQDASAGESQKSAYKYWRYFLFHENLANPVIFLINKNPHHTLFPFKKSLGLVFDYVQMISLNWRILCYYFLLNCTVKFCDIKPKTIFDI